MNVSDRQRAANLLHLFECDLRALSQRLVELQAIIARDVEHAREASGLTSAAIADIRRSGDPDDVLAQRYAQPVSVIRSVR